MEANPLACPEGAEPCEHDADYELEGVLGHAAKRLVDDNRDCGYEERGDYRTEEAGGYVTIGHAEGNDDKDDLQPFQKHPLEGDRESGPVYAFLCANDRFCG